MLLGQILYTSVLSAHTIANQEKQSILQSLVKRQVLYDDSISIDSVITWSEQLLPTLQSNEDRTTIFYYNFNWPMPTHCAAISA